MGVAKGVCIWGWKGVSVGVHGSLEDVEKGVSRGFVVTLKWAFGHIAGSVVLLDPYAEFLQCVVKRIFAEVKIGNFHVSPMRPFFAGQSAVKKLPEQIFVVHGSFFF